MEPQSDDLANWSPFLEIRATGHVRGDRRVPGIHRVGAPAKEIERVRPWQVVDQPDRRRQQIKARVAGRKGMTKPRASQIWLETRRGRSAQLADSDVYAELLG